MFKFTVGNKIFSVGHKYINKKITKDKMKKGREGVSEDESIRN